MRTVTVWRKDLAFESDYDGHSIVLNLSLIHI